MSAELGQLALALALAVACVQALLPLLGAWRGRARWMALARPAACAQALLVSLASAALVHALVSDDFSLRYVVDNANSQLPVWFKVAAYWGGHEGSVLLWIQMLALWGLAVAGFSRALPAPVVARVLGTMGLIGIGFLCFLLFTSNPFERQWPPAADGHDLNPMLQDLGMIAHPPLLYMGYVGFSVAFSFAIAALLGGRLDAAWARWTRPWTLAAWACLTLGIALGSAWAYYVLGWGGWWFWDAVENASFMPWLVGSALLHSLAVTEKRNSFRNWTVLLAIVAFSLSLLGTFLVRSGVLSSVHSFANDPRRGVYILIFLALVSGGSLALYAWRAPQVGLGRRFALVSRESLLMLNNVLLAVAAGTVLLGTLYPLLLDATGLGRISVGAPYFETVFVPLMAPLLVLMGIGPLLTWKQASLRGVWRRLRVIAAVSVALALWAALVLNTSVGVGLGVAVAAWVLLATAAEALKWLWPAQRAASTLRQRLRGVPGSQWGMWVAHAGVAVFVAGVTLVKGLESASDHSLRIGDSAVLGAQRFTFAELTRVQGPNYVAARARFDVTPRDGGPVIAQLWPEKRFYPVQQMPMTDAAIDRGFWRDLYVSLAEATPQGAWVVRLQVKPFMNWVWAGAVLIALGGALAAADRRYRSAARREAAAATSASSSHHVLPST
ncbi:heme lyase CcmF/NrfE family subunit [Ideonella sp. YS5]|uniref:heme lyase CcmF/NrfE family subunit n=1 Tax=Ideonella sp. YS5 TaxID=3453714 RepID=UPI003EEF3717